MTKRGENDVLALWRKSGAMTIIGQGREAQMLPGSANALAPHGQSLKTVSIGNQDVALIQRHIVAVFVGNSRSHLTRE